MKKIVNTLMLLGLSFIAQSQKVYLTTNRYEADYIVFITDSKYEAAASTVFGELIGNISEHSEYQLEGFAALQKYGGKRSHIQTVISDGGKGISATLRPSLEPKLR